LIAQEIGDVRGRGIWLSNLGLVYDDLHQPQKALEYHTQAVAIAREIQDQRGLAARLGNLGNCYVTLGDYVKAVGPFTEAAVVFRALGDRQALALRLGILGNLYAEMGRRADRPKEARRCFTAALDHYQQTLEVARELGDKISEAELLRSMGTLLALVGNYRDAIHHFIAAGQFYAELGMMDHLGHIQQSLESVQAQLGGQPVDE
jgi:tetratricopeptide (TPR) repeat protein